MIEGIIKQINDIEDLTDINRLREQVSNIESVVEQSINTDDIGSYFVNVLVDNQLVGCGRLYAEKDYYIIDNLIILDEFSNDSYEDLMIRMLIDRAFSFGVSQVIAYARIQDVDYYKRIGFLEDKEVIASSSIKKFFIREDFIIKYCGHK